MKLSLPKHKEDWVRYVEALELPFVVRHKYMFGGVLFYFDGKPAAGVASEGLGLKVSPALFGELKDQYGAYYFGLEQSKSYIRVPDVIVANPAHCRQWILEHKK